MDDLSGWLVQELKDRGWSQRELARRSGVSHSTVSEVVANVRAPSWDFCANVAGALNEQPDRLFVLAGLKRSAEPRGIQEQEAISMLRDLPEVMRGAAVAMLRGLAGRLPASADPALNAAQEGRVAYTVEDELERELLETFRQLPERWQVVILEDVKRTAELGMVRIIGEDSDDEAQEVGDGSDAGAGAKDSEAA